MFNENFRLQQCFGNKTLWKDLTRNGGGGLAFLLQQSVQYRPNILELVFSDPHKKCVVVAVKCLKCQKRAA